MRIRQILTVLIIFSGMMTYGQTQVMIRARAKDAKFIGTSIGGAKIIIRDVLTGDILAQGVTSGSTGNTEKIVKQPQKRYEQVSEESTAGYLAELDISEPVFVEISAYAPISKKQARVKSSVELWLFPGRDITGDGVVLEIPGFIVDILSPQTHEQVSNTDAVGIKANIVMMCGCPVEEGGTWDSEGFMIRGIVESEDFHKEFDLKQTEKASTFFSELTLKKGYYTITVYAFDPKTGNSGLDKTTLVVR